MEKRQAIVIAYDISRNKIRARVRKILRDWRIGGQKSVSECKLSGAEAEELFLQLSHEIDLKTDNLLMIRVEPQRKILGRGIGRKTNFLAHFMAVD